VLGASRKDWRLAEAEHLMRLASLRLSALQDINSAQALVQGADEILREQSDPGSYAAREQLAKSLAAAQHRAAGPYRVVSAIGGVARSGRAAGGHRAGISADRAGFPRPSDHGH
jgi:hypothetical protein